MRHRLARECEVDRLSYSSQGMVGTHPAIQINLVTEQLFLPFVQSHHIVGARRTSVTKVSLHRAFGQQALKT
jgi:hypothetical protein